jgi:predicted nucleic-acid-binding Zn-ribbon protein
MDNEPVKADSCPKCGASGRRLGKIYQVGENYDVRFREDAASAFSFKEKMVAFACSKCGFVEMYLEKPPKEL